MERIVSRVAFLVPLHVHKINVQRVPWELDSLGLSMLLLDLYKSGKVNSALIRIRFARLLDLIVLVHAHVGV